MSPTLIKQAINRSFSRQASHYGDHADVQIRNAQALADFLQADIDRVPPGEILEVGCGTGIFTTHLLRLFPDRFITAGDASPAMLNQCKQMLGPVRESLQLSLMDADDFNFERSFALVAASFSLQWVTDFYATVARLLTALEPEGQLIFSVPLSDSFSEWHKQCLQAQVPCTANKLPQRSQLTEWCERNSLTLEYMQHPIVCTYTSALQFFRSLKGVGASVNTNGQSLSLTQLRRLIEVWDTNCNREIKVTYNVFCGRITRRSIK